MLLGALVLASCSPSVDPASLGADGQRLLDLSRSTDAIHEALRDASDSGESGGPAWNKARSSLDVLARDVTNVPAGDASVAEAVTFFADSGSIMLGFLQNSDTTRARAFFDDRVTRNYDGVKDAIDDRFVELGGTPIGSTGSSVPAALLIALLVVVGVAVWLFRQAQPTVRGAHTPEAISNQVLEQDAVEPLEESPAPAEEAVVDPPMSRRSPTLVEDVPRSRLQATNLRDVLEAAISRVNDGGWEITLDSPDVKVTADPLRLRRLVGTLLLSATMHQPDHIGVVANVAGDRVILSVGDDGQKDSNNNELPESAMAGDAPAEIGHQLTVARQIAEHMQGSVDWLRFDGVSLYTVDLQVAEDERQEGELTQA